MAPPLEGAGAAAKKASAEVAEEYQEYPAPLPPHLLLEEGTSDYVLVIPSYNRPKMLTERTMKLLLGQRVPLDRIFVFVAGEPAPEGQESQRTLYLKELLPLGLPEENIITGVRGIMHQRNFIISWILQRYGPGKHVVSMDDDLEGLSYKVRTGFDSNGTELGTLQDLKPGALAAWIAHAELAMELTGAHIWSVSPSRNCYFMRTDVISTDCGLCNGYLYGFLARPDKALQPCFMAATEDCERSVRYFAADGVVLRYKMYTAKTRCFINLGGLQDSYTGTLAERNRLRKEHEREGHKMIMEAFPKFYTVRSKESKQLNTMEGGFHRLRMTDERFTHGITPSLQSRRRGEGRPSRRAVACSANGSAAGDLKDASPSSSSTATPSASSSSTAKAASPSASSTATPSASSSSTATPSASSRAGIPAAAGSRTSIPAAAGSPGAAAGVDKDTTAAAMGPEGLQVDARGGDPSAAASPSEPAAAPFAPCPVLIDLEGGWQCGACTFSNDAPDLECAMCGTLRPLDETSWACTFCGSRNPTLVLVCCLACDEVREAEGASRCPRCGTFSLENDLCCVGCGLQRGPNQEGGFLVDSESEPESSSSKTQEPCHAAKRPRRMDANSAEASAGDDACQPWACKVCTFLNTKPEAPVCELCGGARE